MGTSSSFGGPKGSSPLVPSWLADSSSETNPGVDTQDPIQAPEQKPIPPPPSDPNRFRPGRTKMTAFAKSNGSAIGLLAAAIGSAVAAGAGGARQARARVPASREAAVRLLGLVDQVSRGQEAEALHAFNLEELQGKPLEDVLERLVDVLCPEGGTIDEAIARDAFLETAVELLEAGHTDLETLCKEEPERFLEIFIAHSLEDRILNDIGSNVLTAPASPEKATEVERQIRDFIRGRVRDAIAGVQSNPEERTEARIREFVDEIYGASLEIFEALSAEAVE